tara:strand:+ start:1067 stop:1207 length:141 start_codon:yes stop_codon:yes gene_type:complete
MTVKKSKVIAKASKASSKRITPKQKKAPKSDRMGAFINEAVRNSNV